LEWKFCFETEDLAKRGWAIYGNKTGAGPERDIYGVMEITAER
jgi:hypothetical protein